jgi:hypothetical protein
MNKIPWHVTRKILTWNKNKKPRHMTREILTWNKNKIKPPFNGVRN